MTSPLRLNRVEPGHWTALDGRYTILQDPRYLGLPGPPMWNVYDETYGGQHVGVCFEPMLTLQEVRVELKSYHDEILSRERVVADTEETDARRVKAWLYLHGSGSTKEIAEALAFTRERVKAALVEVKATKGIWGSTAGDSGPSDG